MCVVVWCRSSANGDVTVGDPFYSEEQQDQQQLPFTKGKCNMGFPCKPTQLIMHLHVSNFDSPNNILAT